MKKAEPDRAARLAEALRTNLMRRKAQARDQAVSPAPIASDPAAKQADPPLE